MNKIGIEIIGLSYSQTQSGAYALVLGEKEGNRRLPIIIGGFEAQAIAIELENMTPSRPLTHDLFKTFAATFEINIKEVIIYNLVEGIFFAKLICKQGDKEVEIDARTSDAIALAVRFNCPVYTFEFILASAGIILDDESTDLDFGGQNKDDDEIAGLISEEDPNDLSKKSVSDLEQLLNEAIDNEDYEKASLLRDEITKRNAN